MAGGAVGMMVAASIPSYGITLAMLFVIASGITLLQVAANPYVAVIGPAETASSRLNLVQAMNSAGTMLAPMFGAWLILGRSKGGTAAAGTVLTLGTSGRCAFGDPALWHCRGGADGSGHCDRALSSARDWCGIAPGQSRRGRGQRMEPVLEPSLWQHRNLVLGSGDFHLSDRGNRRRQSLHQFHQPPDIGGMTTEQAGRYLTLLWGGMMVGRSSVRPSCKGRCRGRAGGVFDRRVYRDEVTVVPPARWPCGR
jgi:FHS family L-fucose permease-like MFS transporter